MTPPRITPAQLRATADGLNRKALAHLKAGRIAEATECLELAEKMAGAAEGMESVLTPATSARTILPNMALPATEAPRRRGRPTKSRHPFPVALEAKGSNVAEWAESHGYEREVAKSWFAPKPHGRRIPAVAAKLIQKELGVPATDRVWTNGIRD